MKKEVYFIQTGCVCNQEYYLPYASGMLAAYAFSDATIQSLFSLKTLFYKCDDLHEIADIIRVPCIAAFSNYMWNVSFNLKLAAYLKEQNAETIVIFGGHQINERDHYLEQYPFIDYLIFGEGEIAFSKLLRSIAGLERPEEINNISFRKDGEVVVTKRGIVQEDINSFPSPYLSGIFDKIVSENEQDRFAAVIETSRGCPYHCSYCDWGDYNNTVRTFRTERVLQEIEWLGKHAIAYFVIADANFGLFPEDEAIIDKIIETKNRYGYPKGLTVAFMKNSTERIFRMNKKLYENSLSRGATLSMQTLSADALINIHRENIPISRFVELMKLYNENHIPAYTELILGLPGETYDSFCDGINFLIENGQHNFIHVFLCELLPNAEMSSKEYMDRFQIQCATRKFVMRAGQKSIGTEGSSTIVVGTYSMSKRDMLKALVFSLTIQVFHHYGLLRFIAIYLHEFKKLSYREFYESLISWLNAHAESQTGKLILRFAHVYEGCLNGENSDTYYNKRFGPIEFNLPDGAFLEFVMIIDAFYAEVRQFLAEFYDLDQTIEELLLFQEAVINSPVCKERTEVFRFNWVDYFYRVITAQDAQLVQTDPYKMTVFSPYTASLSAYIENVIIKGRRTGESLLINNPERYCVKSYYNERSIHSNEAVESANSL